MDISELSAAAEAWCAGPDNSSKLVYSSCAESKLNFSIGEAPTRTVSVMCKDQSSFSVETSDEFLLDNFFLENIEDAVSEATAVEEVLCAISDTYKDITSGNEEGDNSANEDEEYDYGSDEDFKAEPPPAKDRATKDDWRDVAEIGGGHGATAGNKRLMTDLAKIMRTDTTGLGFSLEPKNEDSMDRWVCKLFNFEDCALAQDLVQLKERKDIDFVELELQFKSDYPFSPPFIRVVYPRFKFHTGHVTIGGSICMELLTNSGWTPTNDIESILIQIRSEMIAGDARIEFRHDYPYDEAEARSAFTRVASQHGWSI